MNNLKHLFTTTDFDFTKLLEKGQNLRISYESGFGVHTKLHKDIEKLNKKYIDFRCSHMDDLDADILASKFAPKFMPKLDYVPDFVILDLLEYKTKSSQLNLYKAVKTSFPDATIIITNDFKCDNEISDEILKDFPYKLEIKR